MKVSSKLTIGKLFILAVLLSCVGSAHAWTYTGTGPWASFSFPNGWTVYEDGYGAQNDSSQTLYANSASNFACYVNFTGGGTKNYCHVQGDPDIAISSSNYCNSSFSFSGPNNPWWCFFYDVWTANMQDELMIQEGWYNGSGGGWGTQIASNVTIAGRTIASVWHANNGSNDVYIFTPASQRTSGSDDIMAYFLWCQSKGLLHNNTLHEVSFGVEVTSSSGWQQFTCNSFSCSWGQNGGGGGGNYKQIKNRATGMMIDGMGRTGNGSACGQWSNSGSDAQKWDLSSNNQIKNKQTSMMIDGMGYTSNGSTCCQWSNSGSNAQKWTQESSGGYIKFRNNQTGLYIDGMGSTSNGANLCQYSSSGSSNQQWTLQ